jgi:hypothetical protein
MGPVAAIEDIDANHGALVLFPAGNTGSPIVADPPRSAFISWTSDFEATYTGNHFGNLIDLSGVGRYGAAVTPVPMVRAVYHGATYENNAGGIFNPGQIYSFHDNFLLRNTGGGNRAASVLQSFRSEVRLGPHPAGGTLSVSTHTPFDARVNVGTGTTVSTMVCFHADGLASVFNGAVTNWTGLRISNPVGPTNRVGITSDLAAGAGSFFIEHVGTALSFFAGEVNIQTLQSLTLGLRSVIHASFLNPTINTGVIRMIGVGGTNNEGLDFDLNSVANKVVISSSTGANPRFGVDVELDNTVSLRFGASTNNGVTIGRSGNGIIRFGGIGGTNNENMFVDFESVANKIQFTSTSGAVFTFGRTIELPPGSVLDIGGTTVNGVQLARTGNGILTMSGVNGTNNEDLRISFEGVANQVRFNSTTGAIITFVDDVNFLSTDALGGGAAPTLGTIGGSGPTAAAQARWLRVRIGGTINWIPAWV